MTPLHPRRPKQQRRGFLKRLAGLTAVGLIPRHTGSLYGAQVEAPSKPPANGRPPRILLRSSWQVVMAVGKRWIVDKLPAEVRERVVWRERFWLTDEALSTYVRSAGLFGLEMHSPIMCIGNGVPAIVCRFAEQTSKGIMWRNPSGSQTEGRRSVVGRRVSLVTAVFQKARPRPGPSAL